jgi:hypothetical protein
MTRIDLLARARPRRLALPTAVTAVLACLALHAGPAGASTNQVALIQDGVSLNENPVADLAQMKALGATTVRVVLYWYQVAPNTNSKHAPGGFKASDPAAYPASNWAQYDAIVQAAHTDGMTVDLDISGAPPKWAQGKGVPSKFLKQHYGWEVNAADYGQFVRAVATRYDGRFTPKGASAALPKVSLYSLWNEPNFGQNLGPQNIDATSKSPGYSVAPRYYRNLLRSGWTALKADARGARILVGEFAGQGRQLNTTRKFPDGLPGQVAITSPVPFIQTLYCLNSSYKPLTGKAAAYAGCPKNAGQRRSFAKENPALFDATAISMHPYASLYPPAVVSSKIPKDFIIFPVIGRLTTELGKVTSTYHHTRNYGIWSTEYGYITSPPQTNKAGAAYPSPAQAAIYLNESEYLSYKNPRIDSYAQYLLRDPQIIKGSGLFASGLQYANGKPKPAYAAYRMPLWLPEQSVSKGANTVVWGGARPAVFGRRSENTPQKVTIEQRQHGSWKAIDTVTVARLTGYFDTHVRFTTSGSLRLAYTYPSNELALPVGLGGTTIDSRTVPVTVH